MIACLDHLFIHVKCARQLDASLGAKNMQVDAVTAKYNVVKEKHTATQTAVASAEDLLQTLLTGLAGSSAQSAGGGGA
jgi:structural maintenance of chromosome 2